MTFDDQPSELEFLFNGDFFILQIKFLDEGGGKEENLHFNIEDNKLVLNFVNFNNIFGTGNQDPIEIGETQGKKIFMNVWISKLNDSVARRLIHITLYKEVD